MRSDELLARGCIRDTLARYDPAGDRGRLRTDGATPESRMASHSALKPR